MDNNEKDNRENEEETGSSGSDLLARLKANIAGLGALASPEGDDDALDEDDGTGSGAGLDGMPEGDPSSPDQEQLGDDAARLNALSEYGYTPDLDDDEPDIDLNLPDTGGEAQDAGDVPPSFGGASPSGVSAAEAPVSKPGSAIKYHFVTMTRDEYDRTRAKKKKNGLFSRLFKKKDSAPAQQTVQTPYAPPVYPGQQTPPAQDIPAAVGDGDGITPSEDLGATLQTPEQRLEQAAAKTADGELDRTDEQLMIGLGMENELKQQVGEEKAKEIDAKLEQNIRVSDEAVAISDDTRSRFEYVSPEQTKSVFAYYRACYRGLIWRVAVCILLLIGVFIHENIGIFGGTLPRFMDVNTYPVVHILIGMQYLVLAAALIWKPLLRAVKSIIAAKPDPVGVTAVAVAVSLIYELIMCFCCRSLPAGMNVRTYNLAAVASVLLTLFYELLNVQREIYSFNVTASKKQKFVVAKLEGTDEDTRRENELFADSLGGSGEMFCVRKVQFVDGFFGRVNARPKYHRSLNYLLPAAVLTGLVFFIYGLLCPFVRLGAAASFMGGYASVMMVLPAMALFNYSYPFFKAGRESFDSGSAIVGETSLEEYSAGSTISFDDREVFPVSRVKIKHVQYFGSVAVDKVLYYAAQIFAKTGGPLDDALRSMTQDYKVKGRVELLEIAEDGINAVVDGAHVLVGRADYLTAGGIRPVNQEEDEEIEAGGEVCVMYMVVNDVTAAKFKIQYIIDDDFESILQQLSRAGMCVGIRTFDPNINDRMLSARVTAMRYPVRVIKCRATENRDIVFDRYSSGVISRGSVKELLQTQIYCDRVLHTIRTNTAIKIFSMVIGAVIMGFIVSLGLTGEVNSLEVALYEMFWLIPAAIVARLLI